MPYALKQGHRAVLQATQYVDKHRRIIVFPLLSKLFHLIFISWAFTPLAHGTLHSHNWLVQFVQRHNIAYTDPSFYFILLGLAYLANLCNTIVFGALNLAVLDDIHGKPFRVGYALKRALRHFPSIMLWCVVRSTFGTLPRLLPGVMRHYKIAKNALVDSHWHISTIFSVQLIMLGEANAFSCIAQSAALVRARWGNHCRFRINWGYLLVLLLLIIGIFMFVYKATHTHLTPFEVKLFGILLTVSILGIFMLEELISAPLHAALFCCARDGKIKTPFDEAAVNTMILKRYADDD